MSIDLKSITKPQIVKLAIFLYSIAFFVDSLVQLLVPGQQVSGTPHLFFHIFSGATLLTILVFFTPKIKPALAIFGILYSGLGFASLTFPHSHNGYQSNIMGLDGDSSTPYTHIAVGFVALTLLFALVQTLPKNNIVIK